MTFFRLLFLSVLLLLASCSPRDSGLPSQQGADITKTLGEKNRIRSIHAAFSVLLQKPDTEISGKGDLDLHLSGDLDLQVYSLGFLAMKLTSKNGVIRSTPLLSTERKNILAHGLRDSFFWWDIRDFSRTEEKNMIVLKSRSREIWFDRTTHLPVTQKITFPGGKTLLVRYENPVRKDKTWYQSKMRIEYSKYAVILDIGEISFGTNGALSSRVRDLPQRS